MNYITRVCPYCGKTIVVESDNIPSDVVMTKRKSLTTLAHIKCMPTRDAVKAAYDKGKCERNSAYGKVAQDLIRKGEI